MQRSFLVLGSGLPFEAPLAMALAEFGPSALIELGAFRDEKVPAKGHLALSERWTYPRGFNGTLAWLFTSKVRARVDKCRNHLFSQSCAWPYVITSYPKFVRYLDGTEPRNVVYYNQDDNSYYDAIGRSHVLAEETALIERSGIILCASQIQSERMRQRAKSSTLVCHLPHGVSEQQINSHPAQPAAYVLILGTLSYRYDWRLIREVVAALPEVSFVFAGEIDRENLSTSAAADFDAVLQSPNVAHRAIGGPAEASAMAWEAAAHWLPYDPSIPFNVACCPLKLYTALASGRPTVSSRIPECELHSRWLVVYDTASQAAASLDYATRALPSQAQQQRLEQILIARNNTWRARALAFMALLTREGQPA